MAVLLHQWWIMVFLMVAGSLLFLCGNYVLDQAFKKMKCLRVHDATGLLCSVVDVMIAERLL
jgi:hypothetical protein